MKKISNLGYIMKLLNVSSTELSRFLHVDVSLISKWKSGTRQITPKSSYYDEVTTYLITENSKQGNHILQNFFGSIYPDEEKNKTDYIKYYITHFINDTHIEIPKSYRNEKDALFTAEISIYNDNQGRQKAIDQLLKVAGKQINTGKMITIDCEQFLWLVEDETYARTWTTQMYQLLERGYTFEIIFHFSLYQENFILLFLYCGKILFHRNTTIYYHKYFDNDIYWFSFFCLEHTMSVMGLSMTKGQSHSTVFTDTFSVMQHQGIVEYVKKSCIPMFQQCLNQDWKEWMSGKTAPVHYWNCQLPELLFAKELLIEVLEANHATGNQIAYCLTLRDALLKTKIIFFYSNKEIAKNRKIEQINCPLLSYLTGISIGIDQVQFRKLLEMTQRMIAANPLVLGCFLEEAEEFLVPSEYCSCAQEKWLFTLNNEQGKMSRQSTLLDTAAVVFEQAWRKIPPNRKY